jgi:hypothetical protein
VKIKGEKKTREGSGYSWEATMMHKCFIVVFENTSK